jgi:hypothetical protein
MIGLAMPASRSLIALLVGTVVFFALWLVALKPSSSSSGGSGGSSSQGLGSFQSDINKAHQAVATSNASNAASGNENVTSSSGGATASHQSAKPASKPHTASSVKSSAESSTKPSVATTKAQRHALANNLTTVRSAISAHRAVALLFYNPAAADDQAVKQELAAVPTHKGHVVKLAIPLKEASAFTAVTQQVPVNLSPTLVIVSSNGQASEIVGFSTGFEISQRVDDALAVN